MKIILLLAMSFSLFAFDHNHSEWNDILKTNTSVSDKQTSFHYESLKNNQTKFDSYLNSIENLSKKEFKKFSKDEKLAFWINVYNAYTVKLILNNYPLKSIKKIGGWFSSPWKIKFIKLFGKKISLDMIEHQIIRKKFNEPRIHFAVNCASIGCPSLLTEAFVAKNLNEQLDKAAINFLNNPMKNKYDSKTNTLFLSKIFDWYGNDFNKKHGSYLEFVKKYIKYPKDVKQKWLDYNWNLNEGKK